MTPPPTKSGGTSDQPARGAEPGASLEPRPSSPGPQPSRDSGPAAAAQATSLPLLQRLKGWLDLALVADVFLVIAAALWFALAVVLHSRGVEAPLHLFQLLWEPLFTPAIGLLMAAALLSGALGWWQRRGQR